MTGWKMSSRSRFYRRRSLGRRSLRTPLLLYISHGIGWVRDYDGELEKGKKGEVNSLKQPMTRGMQNQVLFFHVL